VNATATSLSATNNATKVVLEPTPQVLHACMPSERCPTIGKLHEQDRAWTTLESVLRCPLPLRLEFDVTPNARVSHHCHPNTVMKQGLCMHQIQLCQHMPDTSHCQSCDVGLLRVCWKIWRLREHTQVAPRAICGFLGSSLLVFYCSILVYINLPYISKGSGASICLGAHSGQRLPRGMRLFISTYNTYLLKKTPT
jgi:hypothetical protein